MPGRPAMGTLEESLIICRAEVGFALRSGRTLALLVLYVLFTAIVGVSVRGCAVAIGRQVETQQRAAEGRGGTPEEIRRQVEEATDQGRREFVKSAFAAGDDTLTEALLSIPLPVLVTYKATLFFVPLLAALLGFDQIAGELGSRSLRYLAIRSRRASILLGKLLAQTILLAGLMLAIDAALCLYGQLSQPSFTPVAAAATLFKLWPSAVVFCLPYLALTALASTLATQPALSLTLNLLALFGLWLLGVLSELSTLAGLRHASVWSYRVDLLNPELARLGGAIGAHLGFAALFLGAAIVVLRRRDV